MKKKKILKKGIASLLAVVLIVGLLPIMPSNMTSVQAANSNASRKTIAGLGTDSIADPTAPTSTSDAWTGSYVYFGTYVIGPVKYRVLDSNTTVYGGTTMLLDCDSILWANSGQSSTFDADSNVWADSDIRTYLNGTFLTDFFSPAEQNAIAESTVASHALTTDSEEGVNVATLTKNIFGNYVALDNDKVFLLDVEDVSNGAYGYSQKNLGVTNRIKKDAGGNAIDWWLRSADAAGSIYAGHVSSVGSLDGYGVSCDDVGVSPALNVNLSSVLFTSASGTSKSSALTAQSSQTGTTTGTEWKLTLSDEGKSIKVTDNKVVSKAADGTITVPYTYTDTATSDAEKVNQISVMITDKAYTESDAEILYYGALQGTDFATTSGTGTFALPSALDGKVMGTDYHVYILAEHTNTGNATDYAGTPVEITEIYDEVSSVAVTDITAPVGGTALDTEANCATTGIANTTVTWKKDGETVTGNAAYHTAYTAEITLSLLDGYVCTDTVTATVNGANATVTKNGDGTLTITVTYDFPATAKDKLVSITQPQSMTVGYRTPYEDMRLPTTVDIVTEGGSVTSADVVWDTDTPVSGSYDQSQTVSTEQTVTLKGTVTCPESVDTTGVELTTTIIITIEGVADAAISGTQGDNGWYTDDVTLTAPDGWTISLTEDGAYTESVTISEEMNTLVTYYLKKQAGKIAEKQVDLKIDINDPTARYQIGTNGWKQFINTITFGLFCKEYQEISIEYSDTQSAVATKQCYIANKILSEQELGTIQWSDYTDKISLEPTGKYFVYTRVVDNAGREVILNSEGVVIYTDSAAVTDSIIFIYKQAIDKAVSVELNGNTIKGVKNGDTVLTLNEHYSFANGVITLKQNYLNSLEAGTYTFSVSYNPQGVATDMVNMTTTFTVVVEKANIEGVTAPVAVENLVYNGNPLALITAGSSPYGEMQYSLDDVNYSTTIPTATKAGTYTIYYKVVGDANHNDTEPDTVPVSIAKKPVTAMAIAPDKVYGESVDIDPSKITITFTGILEGDEVTYSVTEAWYQAHIVTDAARVPIVYNVSGKDADNYAFTEMGDYIAPNYYVETTAAILPRELTIEVQVADKQYDGTNSATITSATLKNVVDGDAITLVHGVPTFDSVNVAENIGITFTDFTLSGDAFVLKNYTLKQPEGVTANITNNWTPTEYTVSTPNGNGWLKDTFVVTAADGYRLSLTNTVDGIWSEKLAYNAETADGSVTFYVKNTQTGVISLATTESWKLDKTSPTGKVEFVERKAWQEFVNTITFGLFFKDEVTVKIGANDSLSGVAKLEYVSSDKAMALDEVKAITDWTEYNGAIAVTLEDAKQFVYFVRITDKAGNVTYLSTDGAVYDTTTPVIEGIVNGEVYYTTQNFTVTETNLEKVTVNGVAVDTVNYVLAGDTDVVYTVVATDKAGNSVIVTVTMKTVASICESIKDLTTDNVTGDDADIINALEDILDSVDTTHATDAEKDALEDVKADVEELLEEIQKNEQILDDTLDSSKDITSENYDVDSKETLEEIADKLEDIIDENNKNYTEAEKDAAQKELDRVNELIDSIEEVEEVLSKLEETEKLLEAIEDETDIPDSKDAIEKAMEAKQEYDALDEEQKVLVGEEKAQLLTELYNKAVNFVVIKGVDSEYVQNSGKGLSFTANGVFDFFTAVKVDGNVIDAKNYTAKSGSTIVELTEDYLMTLKVGTHTFEVMYEVLEEHRADCSFTVKEAPVADDESKDETPKDDETIDTNSPTTGDDSNIFGWMCMMIVSAMTIILSCKKRRKN